MCILVCAYVHIISAMIGTVSLILFLIIQSTDCFKLIAKLRQKKKVQMAVELDSLQATFVAGLIGGGTSRIAKELVLHPIDTIK
jgi:hypothetical protein